MTVAVVGLLFVLVAVAALVATLGAVAVARHRASAAADLSALAAAGHRAEGQRQACAAAARVARAQGAQVVACTLDGEVAAVVVVVRPGGRLGQLGLARAAARAGPADSPR